MIFLIGNRTANYTICFPLFILQDTQILTFPFSILLILEALLTTLAAFYVLKTAVVCVRIRAFHKNMTVMIFTCALQWIESVVSNVLLKPYETGIWTLGTDSTPPTRIKQWWTDDESRMIHLADTTELRLFFVGGFLKWHYIMSMVLMLSLLSIERVFACYFIHDYEKKSRNGVLFFLVFGYQTLCLAATVGFFLNAAHFVVGVIAIVTPNVLAVGIFTYTRYFNRRIIRSIERSTSSHTYLPAKFQARENIRCFKMIEKVIIAALFIIVFACSVNVLMFLEVTPQLDTLWNILFENSINLNPLIVCPTLLLSVDAWRKFSMATCFCRKLKLRRVNKVSSMSDMGGRNNEQQTRKETDAYFDQLNAAWT